MRKIVVTEFMTLDGVIENPGWSMGYWNDEIASFKGEEQLDSDALLLGRVTYDGFAAAWPNSKDEGAPQMNGMPKYVVSATPKTLEWNNSHLITGDVVAELQRLKQEPGKNLLVYGSGKLIQTLMQHDLVDQYRLLIYPVVVGSGQRLFPEGGATTTLKVVEQKPMGDKGVIAVVYERERNA